MNEAAFEPIQLAPHSQDAEEMLLGSILINPAMLLEVMSFLKPDHFFILRNEWVYEAMLRLQERGDVADYIPVIEELRDQKRLEDIGGAAYLTYLTSNVGYSFDAETYAWMIYRDGVRRQMLNASTEIARLARDENQPIDSIVNAAEDTLSEVTGAFRKAQHSGLKPIAEVIELATERYPYPEVAPELAEAAALQAAYDDYQDSLKNILKPGYADLDKYIWFVPSLYHVCGRPRVGKSMFMQNIIYNILLSQFVSTTPIQGAVKLRNQDVWLLFPTVHEIETLPALSFFSAEMTVDQINKRWISMITHVSTKQQLTGEMTFDEFCDVEAAKKLLKALEARLLITAGTITPKLIRSEIRLWRPDVVFVDYTQKLHPGTNRFGSKTDEVSHVCGELQDIALTEGLPLMSGAQINREGSSAPTLETIKASGSIEEDSDVVILLHRPELYEENCTKPNIMEVHVAKNRNGETAVIDLFHRKSIMRLANAKRIDLSNLELV